MPSASGTPDSSPRQSLASPLFRFNPKYHLPVLLLIALIARLAVFHLDEVIFSWRSTDMASIAINYCRNGFDFMMPQVQWGGNGPGYVETEFPLLFFLVAILFKVFGVGPWPALVVPLISGLGLVVVVYLFCQEVFDATSAFLAGIFAAVSPPMTAMSIALWPDPPMIFCGALGLYALYRWTKSGGWGAFVLGGVFTSLSILLKLTGLYLGLPILYLCYVRFGKGLLKKPVVWFLAALILLPPLWWYLHAHATYLEYHNTFGIVTGGFLKFGTAEVYLNPSFYYLSLGRMIFYHFTPMVFCFFLFGLFTRQQEPGRYVFHIWFIAILIYFLVAAKGVSIGHFQYMLPVVPPGAALAGFGVPAMLRKLESSKLVSRLSRSLALVSLSVLFLAGAVWATYVYQVPKYTTHEWTHDRETGLAVGQHTPPGSLIMVVDNQMGGPPDGIMTPPNVFYFSDRKGWYVALSWLNGDLIEKRRQAGAQFLVITANTTELFSTEYAAARGYLSSHYPIVFDDEAGIMYDLRGKHE
jgi:4-amino-4-deoxy-L-arabinose transferase-like glycosyltransferase